MPSGLTFAIKGQLLRIDLRFAREHALAEITQRRRRSRWWHLESAVLTRLGGGGTPLNKWRGSP